jgi:hypothetical protein
VVKIFEMNYTLKVFHIEFPTTQINGVNVLKDDEENQILRGKEGNGRPKKRWKDQRGFIRGRNRPLGLNFEVDYLKIFSPFALLTDSPCLL